MIAHSQFLGYAAALADGEAAYLLWAIGGLTLLTWAVGLSKKAGVRGWYRVMQAVALLALPVLLIIGMVASMIPVA
ncbi:hypothetical protein LMG27177_01133 [Paraburkholderia fynbosensis]|uniref:Uncharacterized protein n=1 Tax=Paraburkholderia fynbosensis TaxID=1200993 RepID=A0A6J5FK37_9BURK|nr:hypothetical protein LMG27177_01133 [Paraburkholderia fynbosensis]